MFVNTGVHSYNARNETSIAVTRLRYTLTQHILLQVDSKLFNVLRTTALPKMQEQTYGVLIKMCLYVIEEFYTASVHELEMHGLVCRCSGMYNVCNRFKSSIV